MATATIEAQRHEALSRAETGQSWSNYPAIMEGFAARGIPTAEILPRVNVFTYRAWQAKGRQVRKGEKGIRVTTYVKYTKKEKAADGTTKERSGRAPKSATVFHITQTDAAK